MAHALKVNPVKKVAEHSTGGARVNRHVSKRFAAILVLCLAAGSLLGAEVSQKERTGVARGRTVSSAAYRYLAITPANFNDQSVRWPLIVYLHGGDQAGSDLNAVKLNGPPKYALSHPDFPFVVVAPLLPAGKVWEPGAVLAVTRQAMRRFRADPGQVYLTGISTGGYGTWKTALKFPDKFTAIVPVAGGGNTEDLKHAEGTYLQALRSLPVWAFHGGADSAVSPDESERMVSEFRAIGNSSAQATIYPGAPHDVWDRVYGTPDLYNWLLQLRR